MTVSSLFASRRASTVLTAVIAVSTATLLWIGYRAVTEWQRAAAGVARRRAESAVDLVITALSRDMQGAQQILSAAERDGLTIGKAVDLLHPIASALAKYPYVDTFFSWKEPTATSVIFYSRAERRPAWLTAYDDQKTFPVIVGNEPTVANALVTRISKDAKQGRRFSIFDTTIGGTPTQIVALISYSDPLRKSPAAVLGFAVDLNWVATSYFRPLIRQLARIEGGSNLQLSLIDEHGTVVFGRPGNGAATATTARRSFPMGFFEPMAMAVNPPPDLILRTWIAEIRADQDPTLAAAELGARRTLLVSSAMAVVLVGALIVTWKAGRASTALAEMRSDFVSAVTHELKTPIANLRAINDTLASERSTIAMTREYAQMGIREAQRLSRLVDNLLAYARITDVADAYSFERVDVPAVVDRTVREFSANLTHGGFAVTVDLPEKLPAIRADATALNLMLNNIVDNAIRYSKEVRDLHIAATATPRDVTLTVTDKGVGIPADDIERVTRKFTRVNNGSEAGGSGLGLAIVDRIVHDHGGSLNIHSRVGAGTSVAITLPVAGS